VGGSGKTGAFGPPSLVAAQARTIPVPSSNCGVPAAAAYSMNFVSVTPLGQTVGWIAAWPDDTSWPGTVVLNAVQGGVVDNPAIVPTGTDGGIQVLSTNDGDLVIDMNGYYVQAPTIQGPSGATGGTGAPGAIGPVGATGSTGTAGSPGAIGPIGVAGNTGPAGAIGLTGAAGVAGASGAAGPAGSTGPNGVTGAIGPTGTAGATGIAGPAGVTGALGPTGAAGITGAAGPAGPTGVTGAIGPAGPAGPSGSMAAANFFALMPPDNFATVAPGTDVSFPQDGPSSGAAITRASQSTFNLAAIGIYQVTFQVSVNEPAQLILTRNGTDLAYTVVGRATGTSQLAGTSLVTTTAINSILTVRNPAGNSTALTITPLAGGTRAVSASLVITQIQ
jgi:Collagen triple helix repeat (20 copies)